MWVLSEGKEPSSCLEGNSSRCREWSVRKSESNEFCCRRVGVWAYIQNMFTEGSKQHSFHQRFTHSTIYSANKSEKMITIQVNVGGGNSYPEAGSGILNSLVSWLLSLLKIHGTASQHRETPSFHAQQHKETPSLHAQQHTKHLYFTHSNME